MAVTFTPEQQKVIDLHGRNILVSAAAGSGKTAVLVERIIQMISDEKQPVDIDRLLVVTFTNAAAAEMRERIGRAIEKKLSRQPENLHLQRQSALLHNALITTIDSFCLFIIRNNFNDIGLDPGFRVADEGELKLLKQDVLTELLEKKYAEGEGEFLECVEYFTGGSNDRLLEEYILKLYEFAMSCPWPEEWLKERKKDYDITDVIEMENTRWCQFLTDYLKNTLKECGEQLGKAYGIACAPQGPYVYAPLLEREQEMLYRAGEWSSLQEIYEGFETIRFDRLPGKKDDSVREDYKERAKQLRNEVKKQLESLRTGFLMLSPEQSMKRLKQAQKPVEQLMELVLCFKKSLDEKKRRENMIDFYDMEHFALNILLIKKEDGSCEASRTAREYRQHFHEILIDEYQDSNLVQELLLKSVSGEDENHFNRFMVGDVKQSIYKFRLARPELFMEKYETYTLADSDRQRIDLHKNFRSRNQVLESVNALFYRIMGTSLGGVEYDEAAALYPGAVYPDYHDNQTEYLLIEKDKESSLSAREQEAAVIAGKIKKLIRKFQVTDKETGKLRPASYRDIVILLRTTSGWAEEFKRIFEKEGVPAHVASGTGYFQTTEVRELLQLLRIIDNPLQDIPLFGVLKSFFGGFTEEEIAEIRSSGKQGASLYEQLKENSLDEKAASFLQRLETFRQKAVYTPIHRLIQDVFTETGYLNYAAAKPGGIQRKANLEMLLTRAAAFEKTSYYGLFHFLRYIEQLEKFEVDYGEADILDESADVVRIMSIHKSKGLEFPICFVAGLAKKFNMQDTTGRLIADVDMGIGADYIDNERRIQSKTLRKNAVALKLKTDSLGEELRVLYVAMTRAEEKLFLTGTVNDSEKLRTAMEQDREFSKAEEGAAGSRKKISFSVLANAGSYLDFILPCLEQAEWICPEDVLSSKVKEGVRAGQAGGMLAAAPGNEEMISRLLEKFDRQYAYPWLSRLYVKTTVSELKKAGAEALSEKDRNQPEEDFGSDVRLEEGFTQKLYEEPEVIPYIPSFIEAKEGMSGTDRGSAYHKVMELLDFKRLYQKSFREKDLEQEIEEQLEGLAEAGKITSKWKEGVSLTKLFCFFKSPLAKRMMDAAERKKLYKEQPFVLGLPANRLDSAFPSGETILIQGIIDVYFEEEGKIIVADYKTDAVKKEEVLLDRYRIQLDYYAEALERLTGKAVCEKIIYSFALGKEITCITY